MESTAPDHRHPSPQPPAPRGQDGTRDWFEDAFDEDYRLVYSARSDAQARDEVRLLARVVPVEPADLVLDLCCGHGRHLRALAAAGVRAVGVDLSRDLLRDARRADPATPLARADMRRLPLRSGFDVVLNLFTSFGYFEQERDHERTAREMARVLRPGGRVCVDLMNSRHVVATLQAHTERRVRHLQVTEDRRFDAARRRVEKQVSVRDVESGRERRYSESVRVFTLDEARALFDKAGVRIERVLGDFDGEPFTAESPRMILIGRRV